MAIDKDLIQLKLKIDASEANKLDIIIGHLSKISTNLDTMTKRMVGSLKRVASETVGTSQTFTKLGQDISKALTTPTQADGLIRTVKKINKEGIATTTTYRQLGNEITKATTGGGTAITTDKTKTISPIVQNTQQMIQSTQQLGEKIGWTRNRYGQLIETYKTADGVITKVNKTTGEFLGSQAKLQKMIPRQAQAVKASTGILGRHREMLTHFTAQREKAFKPDDIARYNKQIKGVQKHIDKLTGKSKKLTKATANTGKAAKDAGGGFLGLGESLGHTAKKVAMWTISTGVIFGTMRAFKGAISTISEMDSQMVDLQKVFQGTRGELKLLKSDIIEESIAMGSMTEKTMKAAIELGRMGKSRTEISSLMKTSLLAQNIAEIEASDATRFLNAAILQFNKVASDSISILNQWNQLSNTMPVRTIDFAQAVSAAGSVIRQAGGEIEDLNAYTAALSATMAKTGREIGQALKTIASYMYRPKTKAKIEEITGIVIEDQAQSLMDIDDILIRLAARWDKLTEAQQENLAQTIAGVRRKAFFLNLMQNFDIVLEAHAKQWKAAGSAMRENEIRLSSLKTKVEQLQATFAKLAIETGDDSGVLKAMKGMTDQLRYLVEGFSNATGAGQLFAIAGVSGALIGISALIKKIQLLSIVLKGTMASMLMWAPLLIATTVGVYALTKAFESEATKMRERRREIEKSIQTTQTYIETQQVIIDQFEVYGKLYEAYEDMRSKGEETEEVQKKLKTTLEEIKKLNPGLVLSIDDLAGAYKRLGEAAEEADGKAKKSTELMMRKKISANKLLISESKKTSKKLQEDAIRLFKETKTIPHVWLSIIEFKKIDTPISEAIQKQIEGYEQSIKSAKTAEEKQKAYNTAVLGTTRLVISMMDKSENVATNLIEAMQKVNDSLVTRRDLINENIESEKQIADLYKEPPPKGKPEIGETPEELKARLNMEKQIAKERERHEQSLARLHNRELDYWEWRLETEKDLSDLDVVEIQNRIEILKITKDINRQKELGKKREEEAAEKRSKALKVEREALRIVKEKERIYERMVKTLQKAQLEMDILSKQPMGGKYQEFDLNQPGSYALLNMDIQRYDRLGEMNIQKEAIQESIKRILDESGNKLDLDRPIETLGDIKTIQDSMVVATEEPPPTDKAVFAKEPYKEMSNRLDDLTKLLPDIKKEEDEIAKIINKQIDDEKLRQGLLQDRMDGLTDEEIIQKQKGYIEQQFNDGIITQEQYKLELLELQTAEMGLQAQKQEQRQRQIANDITNTLNQTIRNWQAGRKGAEVGADFAEGMGQMVGNEMGRMLGETVGGMVGNMILPGIGGALGSLLFSELGKLIGWEKEPPTKLEEKIDENVRALRDNTDAFRDFNERFINAPAGFMLPPAGQGALPEFANEGTVTRTGYAKVDRNEVIMDAGKMKDIANRGQQSMTASSVSNRSIQCQSIFGDVKITNPSSDLDVYTALKSAADQIYNEGMQVNAFIEVEH